METPKEENVEYHIEIQKCEEGVGNNEGEVMYVLDFGGADIPENLAMSIAQWAADRSLPLEDGSNSFVVQNDSGVEMATQVLQVDSGAELVDGSNGTSHGQVVDGDVPQVIHVKMEDGSDYIMDGTAAGISGDSIVYNIQDDNVDTQIEPSGLGGRIEQRKVAIANTNNSILNVGQVGNIHIQNVDIPQANLVSRKPFIVRNEDIKLERKSGKSHLVGGQSVAKSSTTQSTSHNKGVDRLPITPFLKGKTPVMLMVGEDGQVTTDVSSIPQVKVGHVKSHETTEKTLEYEAKNSISNSVHPINEVSEPMILDFPTEKSELESLRAEVKAEKNIPVVVSVNQEASSSSTPKDVVSTKDEGEIKIVLEKDHVPMETSATSDAGIESDNKALSESAPDVTVERAGEDKINNEESDSVMISEDMGGKIPSDNEAEEILKQCMHEDCDFLTSEPSSFTAHLEKVHADIAPYCCFLCDKKFKLDLTLKIHQLFHMKDAKPAKKKRGPYGARDKFYHCPVCEFKNKYKREAQLHLKEEHDVEKTYTCESCKFICLTQMELDEHKEKVVHRTDNKNYCDICHQLFTNIYQHKSAVHTNERPHCCTECGYKAKTKSSLRYHMVTHLTTKDWHCTKCPYKSTTERRLKRHMKIHDPNKKHICNLCSFSTHDSYEFKRHHIKVHSKTKTYTCKFCDQKFDKHHEIRLHLMFEHDCNDAFFCNHCEFTCSSRADYKEHIQTHYGRHKHVCEICGFTGRYKTHYRRHMLTHSEDRPHECNICGKKVSEASNLRRHMLTHSEDKPLACSVCGYRCKIRSRLMNHMKTHSELRPFACHLCKYTTKFNGNLMKHLENHAKYKPHKCQYCSYSCNERNKLKRHMAFRHKGLLEPKQEVSDQLNEESEANNSNQGVEISAKNIISTLPSSKDQILLLPNKELVVMQGDNDERIVLPVDENGLVMASADQEDLMAQLERGSVVLTVEDAPLGSDPQDNGEHVSVVAGSGDASESVVVLSAS